MLVNRIMGAPSSVICFLCQATGPFEEFTVFSHRGVEFRVANGGRCPHCTESRSVAHFKHHSYCKKTREKIYQANAGVVWVNWENYVELIKLGVAGHYFEVNRALLHAQVLTRSLDGSFGVYVKERVATSINEDGDHYFFTKYPDALEYAKTLDPDVEARDRLDIRKMRPLSPDAP